MRVDRYADRKALGIEGCGCLGPQKLCRIFLNLTYGKIKSIRICVSYVGYYQSFHVEWGVPRFGFQPKGEYEMLKKLTASAATSFLLLGAPGVAMAQEAPAFPPLVVFSVQLTPDVVVDPPIAAGEPCVDAVQRLHAVMLQLQDVNVIQESFLAFVMGTPPPSGPGAILVCAPEGTAPPAPTEPPAPPPPPA
jgi:hypothetical protein